ncbi:YceD family protein [Merismopedia glauca]|uniref:Metal-binding protein n=1 Tax=Merismopedia glauca CCAP 1448/3 TaxID=1296344 RepID=A0A2T1C6X4_9CYAN|nr:YceD family protein [Merismopedia glauca]PSB03999.1 metal-binding protein [Merismopedia glauca CCAP 1448/3]
MEPIYIPHLAKAPESTQSVLIEQFLTHLDTLTPVRGKVVVRHRGNFLEVFGQAETIITLTCDRCLQQYNHKLGIKTSEIIWLDPAVNAPDTGPLERETPMEDLVEKLDPQGHFAPDTWIYEQLCLATPPRKLCDNQCPGVKLESEAGSKTTVDRRWQALEAFKRQLTN